MSIQKERQSERQTKVLGRICSFTASNDDLFSVLVPLSFLLLVVLALLGKAAEMAVVAGFSAVCMAFLRLENFSEFSGVGFSAKLRDVAKKVEAMAVRETEVDADDVSDAQFGKIATIQVSAQEREALQAIEDSPFTFRTATGLAQNLELSVSAVRQLMAGLEEKGLASQIVTSRRSIAWNITAQGRNYLLSMAK
ncbi:hypothetical protein ACTXPD_18635 [Vreelandella alkaliphila]|uniref:Uncharacterized protein n=1 Tax=Halomonas campaniensis TaxID=213554 RepID=A0A3D0KHB6_9GAMM|nr:MULTISPECIES: hypothetical protein [Halomonas]HCA02680.1 hypothetical protein [Halomonas campaniensis]